MVCAVQGCGVQDVPAYDSDFTLWRLGAKQSRSRVGGFRVSGVHDLRACGFGHSV